MRWAERLAAFDFEIHYRKGSTNPADGPSRWPDYEPKGADNNELLLPTLQQKLQGTTAQRGPKTIAAVRVWMARLVRNLPVSRTGSAMEVDSTDGEDAATEPLISTTKSALAQADMIMQENMFSCSEDTIGTGAASPLSEMDEDEESQ